MRLSDERLEEHYAECCGRFPDEEDCAICSQQRELILLRRLAEAVEELLEVAALRGDNDLPHPADDPYLWTARMQEAWGETGEELDAYAAFCGEEAGS